MLKLSTAFAASALLIALSAPSFAAEVGTSTSQHSSTAIQNRDVDTSGSAQVKGSTSSSKTSTMDQERDRDKSAELPSKSTMQREQSAQMPSKDKDIDKDIGPGRLGSSPGHEMQEHGSVPGSPGASGYAPGHTVK